MKRYIRDNDILERIGCGADQFAYIEDGRENGLDEDGLLQASSLSDDEDCNIEYDNSRCDADFEKVEDGYAGQDGFMKGVMFKMERRPSEAYARCVGTYTSDGMYMMGSSRGVTAYLGWNGRAKCLALPQCKMMNSTVLDGYARRTVHVGRSRLSRPRGDFLGDSGIDGDRKDGVAWLAKRGFVCEGTHLPFDLWCVVGAVFGKALNVWRGVVKMDMSKMPCWMYVEVQEVFEALNPGCSWDDLSVASRRRWISWITKAFDRLDATSLAWDLPTEQGRKACWTNSVLENSIVSKRVDKSDEKRCVSEWGVPYEPCGFKVRIRGNAVFDFCWRNGVNSPSVVQVRNYEHDVRKVLGTKGWTRCFHMIWASWLVQYRNYWTRRGKTFATCSLEWSQREMLEGFRDSVFEIAHLSTDEMVQILEYHTQQYVFTHGDKRPAHCNEVSVVKRCVVAWTLPKTLSGESVLVKNDAGVNMSLSDAGLSSVPKEVTFAESRMREINEENANHRATVDGRRLDTSECVIYRVVSRKGVMCIVVDKNGRCYSMKDGVQALKREQRKRVLIDGMRTVEVDYSSLHPMMLYAMNGINYKGDVYNVGRWYTDNDGLTKDEARKACKMMMLRIINARNYIVALYSFKKAWNEHVGQPIGTYIPWATNLYNAIMAKHKAIAHEFCTGRGVELMNMDGRLIREVCHRLARERICALPVHDSVIVGSKYADKATSIMKEEYGKMFKGFDITVKH